MNAGNLERENAALRERRARLLTPAELAASCAGSGALGPRMVLIPRR